MKPFLSLKLAVSNFLVAKSIILIELYSSNQIDRHCEELVRLQCQLLQLGKHYLMMEQIVGLNHLIVTYYFFLNLNFLLNSFIESLIL